MKRILLALALMSAFVTAEARKVTGSVKCGENKLEGVIVTDGTNFTKTLKSGKFTFDIDDNAEFVFIITPAGYVADWSSGVPAFYKAAAGISRFDFQLTRTAGGDDYSIVAMADPQTYSDEHFAKFAGQPLDDICKTIKSFDGVTVGLTLGDISWDRIDMLDRYKQEIVRTGIPFYPVIGNHDYEAYVQGDKEASAGYRSKMGPENYAFCLGKDVVIVLDNIIYDTNFKSTDGYTNETIEWVKGLIRMIPSSAEIYIAQHVPVGRANRKIENASALLGMLRGRKVTFLSGHTHVNRISQIEKNITEHNVAAICGAWWDTIHCTDGTPRGYKVMTKHGGKLSWYYKAVGQSKKHIAEVYTLGQTSLHPNSVVVNIWDWDPEWKVEWYEDGQYRGKMDQVKEVSPVFTDEIKAAYAGQEIPGWKRGSFSSHYFAATPSRYARNVTIAVTSRFGQKWTQTVEIAGICEEHMTCTGKDATLENLTALVDGGARYIRLDLCVDMNGDVTIGHKDGPLMIEVLDVLDEHINKSGRSAVRYNFEMYTVTGKEEGKSVPYYHNYVDFVMADLWIRYMGDKLMLTGSDYRSLNHMNEKYPEVDLAFKVSPGTKDIEKSMTRLKFIPKWISLHYTDATEANIKQFRDKGMYVSVWGIPDKDTAAKIQELDPDAIIY